MTRRVTMKIGGREALPVRAIPYVAPWDQLSPDAVALQLARHPRAAPGFPSLKNLSVYHLVDGQPCSVLPREWDATVANLVGLEAEIREKHPNEDRGYAVWREQAPSKLPAGVFVWVDEFEAVYRKDFTPRLLNSEGERNGDRDLTYNPMAVTERVRDFVLAGFEEYVDSRSDRGAGGANPDTATQENRDWKSEVRRIADVEYRRQAAKGLYPTKRELSPDVARLAREAGIVGRSGHLREETVRKALNGLQLPRVKTITNEGYFCRLGSRCIYDLGACRRRGRPEVRRLHSAPDQEPS